MHWLKWRPGLIGIEHDRRSHAFSLTIVALCFAFAGPAGAQTAGGLPDGPARAMTPIDSPAPDQCITDVTAGDHRFSCGDITYLVMVDEICTRLACGLIFDIHGANMSAAIMRDNTELHELAPSRGYLVVHPSASPDGPGTWSFAESPPAMKDFMTRMIDAFDVDESRIHVTGFSMGAAMTFAFLCNYNDMLASAAVVTGSSADQVMTPDGSRKCIDALDEQWLPRVPILFLNGIHDPALTEAAAQARTDGIVSRLQLSGGEIIAGDEHYTRRHWAGSGGMAFDFIEHDYAAAGRLAGHCMPGGRNVNDTTCLDAEIDLHWGRLALEWFMEHPKQ
jgi:pimeloyl-ACP methyl ester carboxylesterase